MDATVIHLAVSTPNATGSEFRPICLHTSRHHADLQLLPTPPSNSDNPCWPCRSPVSLYALEVVDDGDAQTSNRVQHSEHHHVQ